MTTELGEFVATTSEIPTGMLHGFVVDGERILIANVEGEFLAVGGECTHEGAPLEEGELEDDTIVCPWHFSKFCLRTGDVIDDPAEAPIRTHHVAIVGDKVHVRLGGLS